MGIIICNILSIDWHVIELRKCAASRMTSCNEASYERGRTQAVNLVVSRGSYGCNSTRWPTLVVYHVDSYRR